MSCLNTCLHSIDARMEPIDEMLNHETAIARCCDSLQGSFPSACQESIGNHCLASTASVVQHALHIVSRCLVRCVLENVWKQLLQATVLPSCCAMLKEACNNKIPKLVP